MKAASDVWLNKLVQRITNAIKSIEGSLSTADNYFSDIFNEHLPNKVDKCIQIEDGVDLNTVTTSGFYRLQANLLHAPEFPYEWSPMIVCAGGDTVSQIIIYYASGEMLVRAGTANKQSSDWLGNKEWKTLSITGHSHDWDDITNKPNSFIQKTVIDGTYFEDQSDGSSGYQFGAEWDSYSFITIIFEEINTGRKSMVTIDTNELPSNSELQAKSPQCDFDITRDYWTMKIECYSENFRATKIYAYK